jgi:hypothetical protein
MATDKVFESFVLLRADNVVDVNGVSVGKALVDETGVTDFSLVEVKEGEAEVDMTVEVIGVESVSVDETPIDEAGSELMAMSVEIYGLKIVVVVKAVDGAVRYGYDNVEPVKVVVAVEIFVMDFVG